MIVPRLWSLAWVLGLSLLPGLSARGQAPKTEPDLSALVKAGRASAERLQKECASWTSSTTGPNGSVFIVDVLACPDMRRSIFSVQAQGQRVEIFRLIARGGVWYMTEGKRAGKYRPYEAPSDWPTAYLYLSRSEPRFVAQDEPGILGTYEGKLQGVATYRSPIPDAQRQQLQNTLKEIDAFVSKNAAAAAKPEMQQARARLKDLVGNGIASRIELATGMFVQLGAPDKETRISNFRWRERIDRSEFDVAGKTWDDFTDDPTAGDTSDLLMIGHCGIWRVGMKSPEVDGRLFDLKTGRYRRIPFQGEQAQSGCFLKGRTRVVISGADLMSGVIGLYEIDLKTGTNRQLGGEALASGFSLFPVLSPDGKTVAVLHKGAAERLLDTQVYLVDLATGNARPVGKPHDMAFPSWLPDGSGLILLVREVDEATHTTKENIARMTLDGTVTKLCEGSSPVLLADGKTILFEDSKTRLWQTADRDGGHIQPFADGLKDYHFAAPGPDGKRIIMIRFQPGAEPVPTLLTLGETDGEPVTTRPGLWARPAWR